MRTPTSKGANVKARLPKMARVFQEWPLVSREWPWMTREWPRVSQWGGASVEASPKVSRGGEASDGASPCESRGQAKEVLG